MSTNDSLVIEDYGYFTASATAAMRWVKRLADPNNFNSEYVRVLQQQWKIEHSKNGVSYQWKDVPLEVE